MAGNEGIERGKLFRYGAARVIGHPALRRGEQANAFELRLGSHVEPMGRIGGHADQIPPLAQYGVDPVSGVDEEKPSKLEIQPFCA